MSIIRMIVIRMEWMAGLKLSTIETQWGMLLHLLHSNISRMTRGWSGSSSCSFKMMIRSVITTISPYRLTMNNRSGMRDSKHLPSMRQMSQKLLKSL